MRSGPMLPSVPVRAALVFTLALAVSGCASKSSSPGGSGNTPRELDSGDLVNGADFSHRFFTAGSFGYHCRYHAVMTGVVSVDANAADTNLTVTISTSTGPFPAASVKPGGLVTWHNSTPMTHTVTSN